MYVVAPRDSQSDDDRDHPPVQCNGCRSALHSPSRQETSFLLLGQLAVPLLGCDEHLERFSTICGWTSDDAPELLDHPPAGGIRCPSCRLAPYDPGKPLVAVQDGAVAVTACVEHQSEIVERFRTGLQTQQQLTSDLGGGAGSSL